MFANGIILTAVLLACALGFKLDTSESLTFSGDVGTYHVEPSGDELTPASIMWCFIKLNCTAEAYLISAPNGLKRNMEGEKRELQSKRSYFWTEMVDLHSISYTLEFQTEDNDCRADMMFEQGNAISLGSSIAASQNQMYRFRPPAELTNFYAIIQSPPHTIFGGGKVELSYLFENDPILKSKRAPDCYTKTEKVFEVQLFGASNVLLWVEPQSTFVLTLSSELPAECTPIVDEEQFLLEEAEMLVQRETADANSGGLSTAAILLLSTLIPFALIAMCFIYKQTHRQKSKKPRWALDYNHWASDFVVWADFDGPAQI